MKRTNHFSSFALFALAVLVVILSAARAPSVGGCHKINAKAKGAVVGGIAGVNVTHARLTGGGLLDGSTRAEFTAPESPETFTGTLVFLTKHGTLSFEVDGEFAGTRFTATAVATEGTGKLRGGEGTLFLQGAVNPANGSFTENISGEICFE